MASGFSARASRIRQSAGALDPRRGSAAPLDPRRRTLLACIVGSAAVFLDGTLVNVALPAIRADLGGGLVVQDWVVDGYLLTLGSLLLIGGSLGDVLGRTRIFEFGVAAFGVTSVLCAAAPDAPALIAGRALQGVAGALLVPSTLALITDTFGEGERAAAIGTWTAWTGIATVAGPFAGGALVQALSWRWIFVVNVPLVGVTLHLLRTTPHGPPVGGSIDWPGGALCAGGFAGAIFALIEQPRLGWGGPGVFVPLVSGVVLLGGFLIRERRARVPMLPLGMFAVRSFRVANLATLALYAGLNIVTFFLVVFLQQVAGYRPISAGLALLPLSIITFLLARRFGALADRLGPRRFMGAGPLLCAVGLVLLSRATSPVHYVTQMLPGVVVFALGLAMTVAPLTATVLASARPEHAGIASGINNAAARIAGLVAIAAASAVVSGQFASRLDHGFGPAPPVAIRAAAHRAAGRTLVIDASEFPPAERARARRVLVAASVHCFRVALELAAALAALAGLLSLFGLGAGQLRPAPILPPEEAVGQAGRTA